ncbi:hypothetical protein [Chitinophaga arvensicola]|uniref:hypothetical protein n=1 Tax=Chitinophaga arvensicola TaxID=29529 RepID=UPI00115FA218|nr:hypothetical protein [Chitinophaga arvensicola]
MKKRWWISVITLLPGFWAGAQTVSPAIKPLMLASASTVPLPYRSPAPGQTTGFVLKPVKLFSVADQKFPSREPAITPVYRMAPDAYYQQHFGFFCKQEWSWQKQTGIPVKLRLGSYSYAQQQEGKR